MPNAIKITPKYLCTGCGVCALSCPRKCIHMTEDEREGFIYPIIELEKCISCGKCIQTCPIGQKDKLLFDVEPECYAAWHVDDEIRIESSSGGMFSVLAEYILKKGGTVYGAVIDNNSFALRHSCAVDNSALQNMRKSKYYQSRCDVVFDEIKEKLNADEPVLFTGTPCQVAALRAYLRGTPQDNLYIVDVLCHGVTSEKVFRAYIKYMEKRFHGQIERLAFRVKIPGKMWKYSCMMMMMMKNDGRVIYSGAPSDVLWKGYLENIMLRPSCYNCVFTGIKRVSDITIADFWGLDMDASFEYDTEKGVNLLLVNSKKGKAMCTEMQERFISVQQSIEDATQYNRALICPVEHNTKRERFFDMLNTRDFDVCVKRLFPAYYMKQAIKHVIGEKNVARLKNALGTRV